MGPTCCTETTVTNCGSTKRNNTQKSAGLKYFLDLVSSYLICYHSVQNILSSSLLFKNLKIKIYVTIISSFVLCGCATWSLTMGEKHTSRVVENRVLRRIFRPKMDEVTGDWRKLHNEELNDLYFSPNIVRIIKLRRMRWAGNVARMGERKGVFRGLMGKLDGKSPLGRSRNRWEDNIKMDLQEVGCVGMAWNDLAQDRDRWRTLVNAVMYFRVP